MNKLKRVLDSPTVYRWDCAVAIGIVVKIRPERAECLIRRCFGKSNCRLDSGGSRKMPERISFNRSQGHQVSVSFNLNRLGSRRVSIGIPVDGRGWRSARSTRPRVSSAGRPRCDMHGNRATWRLLFGRRKRRRGKCFHLQLHLHQGEPSRGSSCHCQEVTARLF